MSIQSNKTLGDANISLNSWKKLIILGGVAALLAGILFRRNLAVEIGMFSTIPAPAAVGDWFTLLQTNRILALTYLHVFDLVNYALLSLMFIALYVVQKEKNKSGVTVAVLFALFGIVIYFATNTAFSMLSLSDQYMAADQAQKNLLLASGQAILNLSRFSGSGAHPGNGGLFSILFIAIATMITSITMIRSKTFKQFTAYIGIIASALDLIYCITYVFIPAVDGHLLAVLFIPAAGLLYMMWHIMVGWRLCRLGRA